MDRLLASPHYGERQARHWLDLARYADSQRLHHRRCRGRSGRTATGSSRPSTTTCRSTSSPSSNSRAICCRTPRREQKIATGFHRNTSFNEEGGTTRSSSASSARSTARTPPRPSGSASPPAVPVPRPQVRPVLAEGLLPALRVLRFVRRADDAGRRAAGSGETDQRTERRMEFWFQKNGGSSTRTSKRPMPRSRSCQGKIPTTLVHARADEAAADATCSSAATSSARAIR